MDTLLGHAGQRTMKIGPVPEWQQQLEMIAQLAKPKQRLVTQMLDALLQQVARRVAETITIWRLADDHVGPSRRMPPRLSGGFLLLYMTPSTGRLGKSVISFAARLSARRSA